MSLGSLGSPKLLQSGIGPRGARQGGRESLPTASSADRCPSRPCKCNPAKGRSTTGTVLPTTGAVLGSTGALLELTSRSTADLFP